MLKEMVDTKCLTNFQYEMILIYFFNEFLKIHSAQEKKNYVKMILQQKTCATIKLCSYKHTQLLNSFF